MRYRIVKYMTGWAIQERKYFWSRWDFIRHGDYFQKYDQGSLGKVVEFQKFQEALKHLVFELNVKLKDILL